MKSLQEFAAFKVNGFLALAIGGAIAGVTGFCEQLQTLRPKKLRTFQPILLIQFEGVAL
jgi:hypothetical protein